MITLYPKILFITIPLQETNSKSIRSQESSQNSREVHRNHKKLIKNRKIDFFENPNPVNINTPADLARTDPSVKGLCSCVKPSASSRTESAPLVRDLGSAPAHRHGRRDHPRGGGPNGLPGSDIRVFF